MWNHRKRNYWKSEKQQLGYCWIFYCSLFTRLTQAKLAKRIGADNGYISRIERGLTVPTVSAL